jgi:hypothetical protein
VRFLLPGLGAVVIGNFFSAFAFFLFVYTTLHRDYATFVTASTLEHREELRNRYSSTAGVFLWRSFKMSLPVIPIPIPPMTIAGTTPTTDHNRAVTMPARKPTASTIPGSNVGSLRDVPTVVVHLASIFRAR